MSKQTAKDRAQRLRDGCCPIHGLPMGQEGNDVIDGRHAYIVGCPRKDCDVRASQFAIDGEATLLPGHAHLLGPTPV